MVAILLFSGGITIILTVTELYIEYQNEKSSLASYLAGIKSHQLGPITQATWVIDSNQQRSIIDSLAALPSIAYSALHNERGELLYEAGMQDAFSPPPEAMPLIHTLPTETLAQQTGKFKVGVLYLQGDMQAVRQRMQQRITIVLAGQFVKTFITSLFILFIIHYLINRHLYHIADHIRRNLPKRDNAPRLRLNRAEADANTPSDELDELVIAINQLKTDLDTQHTRVLRYQKAQTALNIQLVGIFDAMTDMIMMLDHSGTILKSNLPSQSKLHTPAITGYDDGYIGNYISLYQQEDSATPIDIRQLLQDAAQYKLALNCYFESGSDRSSAEVKIIPLQLDSQEQQTHLFIIRDTSDEALLREASHYATHDYLTGLKNRFAFDKSLTNYLQSGQKKGVLCLVDLDYFKQINDSLGHLAGDKVLIKVAECMQQFIGSQGIIARIGGDEFAILLHGSAQQAEKKCWLTLDALKHHSQQFPELHAHNYVITASIGITDLVPGLDSPDSVFSRADQACYQVKNNGRAGVSVLTATDNVEAMHNLHSSPIQDA